MKNFLDKILRKATNTHKEQNMIDQATVAQARAVHFTHHATSDYENASSYTADVAARCVAIYRDRVAAALAYSGPSYAAVCADLEATHAEAVRVAEELRSTETELHSRYGASADPSMTIDATLVAKRNAASRKLGELKQRVSQLQLEVTQAAAHEQAKRGIVQVLGQLLGSEGK
ncbi:hypothetical protein WS75_19910 [Burkholderia sp. FL-7-2-10-S1-D7]|uniref:hypothetical protein n=1 Tax=Burkholderia sp. FL-7-2-10-S1-D7 TaxID=1637866 RepID=UPI00075534C2|nr:hypothetical protein [Burkholderia sp. FL-7-2-10-S1-D7]KVF71978.1 hypothetical protein WS75_19910 [Burkholderia sp. FL-7-2-10-S1-D7]